MSESTHTIGLFTEPPADYLPVRWTVTELPDDRSEYHSEISRGWWEESTAEERDRLLNDQRKQLAASVARTQGVQVDPEKIRCKVYDAGPVRPGEGPTM